MPAVSCDPNDLLLASKCLKCIPAGAQNEVIIYLLSMIAGVDPNPNELMSLARCMRCIPTGMQLEVQTYLLCQIQNEALMNSNLLASGIAQLVGGTATVNNANALATNAILLTYYSLNGSSATVTYGTITPGVSFVISSSNGADTNLVSWAILKP